MIPRAELIVRRRLVQAFIDVDYADVRFIPPSRAKNEDGAFQETDGVTLAAQRIRLIPANRRFGYMATNTEAGEIDRWPYCGIGAHDLRVADGYHFRYRGTHWQVMSIEPDNEERTLFALGYYGDGRAPATSATPHPYIDNVTDVGGQG